VSFLYSQKLLMEILLEIAQAILLIWGALCVIALFILLLYLLSIVSHIRGMIKQTQQTYQQAMFFALAPLQKLTDWLLQDNDTEDEEDR